MEIISKTASKAKETLIPIKVLIFKRSNRDVSIRLISNDFDNFEFLTPFGDGSRV